MKLPLRIVALAILGISALNAGEFGQITTFKKGTPVEVGGLTVEFTGQRHVDHPVFKPGFTYYDFQISKGRESKTVSWSSGTGDIGPATFSIGGTSYLLELRASIVKKGWLKEDEFVLWPAKQFLGAVEKSR